MQQRDSKKYLCRPRSKTATDTFSKLGWSLQLIVAVGDQLDSTSDWQSALWKEAQRVMQPQAAEQQGMHEQVRQQGVQGSAWHVTCGIQSTIVLMTSMRFKRWLARCS